MNLALTKSSDDELENFYQQHLDFLEAGWVPRNGIGFAAEYPPKDGDDTGLIFDVMSIFGRQLDVDALFSYEVEDHFRCYSLDLNPSISVNIHLLGALQQVGFEVQHPAIKKIKNYLLQTRFYNIFWKDKWHSSPYYPTAHLILTAVGFLDELVGNAVNWLIETQREEGSWGFFIPTAEETAYCLQALVIARRNGNQIPDDTIEMGAIWLKDHTELPYPPLWIGKCLYSSTLVVRSAILSALMLI